MRPSASPFGKRFHEAEKIWLILQTDFFNTIDPLQTWAAGFVYRQLRRLGHRSYSALMLSSFASRAYLSESFRTKRANCSAPPPTGSCTACSNRSRVAASERALLISVSRRVMTAGGVPAG